jgi:hypothetical protein
MGAFETRETAAKSALPADLPSAKEASTQHPDGTIFRADNKIRYRLRHARWVEVVARQPKSESKAAAKK